MESPKVRMLLKSRSASFTSKHADVAGDGPSISLRKFSACFGAFREKDFQLGELW